MHRYRRGTREVDDVHPLLSSQQRATGTNDISKTDSLIMPCDSKSQSVLPSIRGSAARTPFMVQCKCFPRSDYEIGRLNGKFANMGCLGKLAFTWWQSRNIDKYPRRGAKPDSSFTSFRLTAIMFSTIFLAIHATPSTELTTTKSIQVGPSSLSPANGLL